MIEHMLLNIDDVSPKDGSMFNVETGGFSIKGYNLFWTMVDCKVKQIYLEHVATSQAKAASNYNKIKWRNNDDRRRSASKPASVDEWIAHLLVDPV